MARGGEGVSDYLVEEMEASLHRAFVDKKADWIAVDSNPRGQRFLYASLTWALDEGLLYQSGTEEGDQMAIFQFRLTDEGRTHFGLKP